MLEGRGPEGKEGGLSSSAQESTIGAVLDFAEASQRVSNPRSTGAAEQSTGHSNVRKAIEEYPNISEKALRE